MLFGQKLKSLHDEEYRPNDGFQESYDSCAERGGVTDKIDCGANQSQSVYRS